MKKTWMLALILGLAMCLSAAGLADTFESTVDWDAEYDVVVVGFGAAGATAATTAADEGAKVLLLEKAPEALAGSFATMTRTSRRSSVAACNATAHGSYSPGASVTCSSLTVAVFLSNCWFGRIIPSPNGDATG